MGDVLKFTGQKRINVKVVDPYDDWTQVTVQSGYGGQYVYQREQIALKPGKLFVLNDEGEATAWAKWNRCQFLKETIKLEPLTEETLPELV